MIEITEKKFDELLHNVQKPGRYIGKEINSIQKPFNDSFLKIALCYPDVYEVGMSNFSLRILYEIINAEKKLLAERFFMPGTDMQDIMGKKKMPLFSLETRHFIKDFDIAGFTIQYELNYLPILYILKLANIPLWSSQRKENHPLIIAGGAGLANPEPVADFIDFFLLGEADDIIVPLLNKIHKWKKQGLKRKNILANLNEINYIYVPSLNNKKVKRHIVPDLNTVRHPVKQLVPLIDIVQNRGIVEVDRGCINNCRFCQAGYYYRPKRERAVEKIIQITEKLIRHTGYNVITLLSLSISNYSCLYGLLKHLNNIFMDKKISFSLPSIRIDKFTINLLDELSAVRKSGLTFALETADEELQKSINKNIDIENFIETIMEAARKKWRTIKIYLLIGFIENNNEIDKIIILIDRIIEKLIAERLYLQINLHISPLIRKPLTPLEQEPQLDFKIIENKLNLLKDIFYTKKYKKWLKLKGHNIHFSFLDAILTKGDRKISRVLYTLSQKSSFFDTSEEKFDITAWLDAFKENNIDYRDILYNKSISDTDLPWKKFDFGYNDKFFEQEHKKYCEKEVTPDCINNKCYDCGVCREGIMNKKTKIIDAKSSHHKKSAATGKKYRYKLIFKKRNIFKYISHRDMLNVFEKIFRMVSLPVDYSCGFNQRMKISIIFPLPLMVEGENEILLFTSTRLINEEKTREKINLILKNKDCKVTKIISLNKNKESLHSVLQYSSYLIKFSSKQFFNQITNKSKDYLQITGINKRGLSVKILLTRDSSILKFIENLSHNKFPDLWKKIDEITRMKIY